MYIGTVQLVPKELHQFIEGTGTDNSALLRMVLTGPPNYLLKERFIFLLLSKPSPSKVVSIQCLELDVKLFLNACMFCVPPSGNLTRFGQPASS